MSLKNKAAHDTLFNRWGFMIFPCAMMLALLWLPFGFSIHGLIEEWDVLGLFTLHEPFIWAAADGPLAAHRLRPLTVAPHAIAYMLDENSFYYWHVLLVGSLFVKGVAGSLLGWWLTHSRRWAAVLGLLIVLFPADTMQLSFRSFHINWSISLTLLGVALCACAYTLEHRGARLTAAIVAVTSAMLAAFAYEAAITFVAVPFLLLYARFGLHGAVQRVLSHRAVTAFWILGALVNTAYIIYAMRSGQTYQGTLVAPAAQIDVADRLARVLGNGYGRTLAGGWLDAAAITWYEYRTYAYLLCAAVLIGLTLFRASRALAGEDPRTDVVAPQASPARIALLGLVMIALGYLPFAASMPHLYISQRTFLGTAAGGALVSLAFLIALGRRSAGAAAILAVISLAVAFAAQMFQFDHYRKLSSAQQSILADIVSNAPPLSLGQTLVVIDKRQQINDVWMVREGMPLVLSYLYNQPVPPPVICDTTTGVWQHIGPAGLTGTCEEREAGWTLAVRGAGSAAQPQREVPRKNAVVVTLNADGTATSSVSEKKLAEYRRMLASSQSALAERYRNILAPKPWLLQFDQFRQVQGGSQFTWDFGRWWSMETPTRGSGWAMPGWVADSTIMPVWHSMMWKAEPKASLPFDLLPETGPYRVAGRIAYFAPPTTADLISLEVNGRPIQLNWTTPHTFEGKIPAEALEIGSNVLSFESPVNGDPMPLSFKIDWVSIYPSKAPDNN